MLATSLLNLHVSVASCLNIKTRGRQNVSAARETRLRRADIIRTRRASQTTFYSIEDADVVRILRLPSHIYAYDPVLPRT